MVLPQTVLPARLGAAMARGSPQYVQQ